MSANSKTHFADRFISSRAGHFDLFNDFDTKSEIFSCPPGAIEKGEIHGTGNLEDNNAN